MLYKRKYCACVWDGDRKRVRVRVRESEREGEREREKMKRKEISKGKILESNKQKKLILWSKSCNCFEEWSKKINQWKAK